MGLKWMRGLLSSGQDRCCRRIPGQQILKMLFWVRFASFTFSSVQFIIYRLLFPALEENLLHYRVFSKVFYIAFDSARIGQFLIAPPYLYMLWTGIKKDSKRRLRICLILIIMLLGVNHGIGSIAIYEYFRISPFSWSDIGLTVFGTGIRLFLISAEIFYLRKYSSQLDSPIFDQMLEDCFSNQDESSVTKVFTQSPNGVQIFQQNVMIPPVDVQHFKRYIVPPWQIVVDKKTILGEGQCGTVNKGFIKQNRKVLPVALKSVKDATIYLGDLVKEIKVMIHVGDHKHVVKFYGITSDASLIGHLSIITEYCWSSLKEFLRDNRHHFDLNNYHNIHNSLKRYNSKNYIEIGESITYGTADLVRLSLEVADGMEYLASKKVVHSDLASRNVLLTSNLCVKITDFGIAHRLYNYQMYHTVTLNKSETVFPWRWSALEVMEDLKFSEKSDVWSYGVLLWEVFTLGEEPFDEFEWSTEFCAKIRQGLRLRKPDTATNELYDIMLRCWDPDCPERPCFTELKLLITNVATSFGHGV